jgi:hypothetical protein
MGWEKDLPPGEKLIACFRPFLEHLVGSDLSPKTIQKHVDNLWVLGGEVIRDLNEDPSLRKLPDRLLYHSVAGGGGPLIHNCSEEERWTWRCMPRIAKATSPESSVFADRTARPRGNSAFDSNAAHLNKTLVRHNLPPVPPLPCSTPRRRGLRPKDGRQTGFTKKNGYEKKSQHAQANLPPS